MAAVDDVKPKMSVLRRHPILSADVRRVLAHLKAHGKITSNDILNRPRLKKPRKRKGASAEEEIPWAHAEIKGNWQEKGLKPGPNNSQVLYTKENDVWKLVVSEDQIEKFLRKQIMDPASKMPLGRDSAYHIQKHTVGISRRALYKFLEKGFLQIRGIENISSIQTGVDAHCITIIFENFFYRFYFVSSGLFFGKTQKSLIPKNKNSVFHKSRIGKRVFWWHYQSFSSCLFKRIYITAVLLSCSGEINFFFRRVPGNRLWKTGSRRPHQCCEGLHN